MRSVGNRSLELLERPTHGAKTAPRATQRRTPGRAGSQRRRAHVLIRWPLWALTRIVLPLCLLVSIFGGVLWVRLLNGAIPLKPMAGPIARAIAADMPGLTVSIDDASVQMSDAGALELRLSDVKFSDDSGTTVALAKDAAVTLSSSALWAGRIAPSRMVLIEPRLLMRYTREGGLSLSFARGDEPATNRAGGSEPLPDAARPLVVTGGGPVASGQADMIERINAMLGKVGRSSGTSSYIKSVGLRNATLVIDSGGRESNWRIAAADFGFDHGRQGSVIGGDLRLESARGPWKLTLLAARDDADNALSIDMGITDLVPSAVAGTLPSLAALSAIDLPVNGSGNLKVSGSSGLSAASLTLDLGRGAISPGWKGDGKLPVEGGRLTFRYDPANRQVALATSRVNSGTSWATFAGRVALPTNPGEAWLVELDAVEGMLGAEDFGIAPKPLEAFRVRGSYDPVSGGFDIAETVLRAAGGEIGLSGYVAPDGSAKRTKLLGRIAPMSAEG